MVNYNEFETTDSISPLNADDIDLEPPIVSPSLVETVQLPLNLPESLPVSGTCLDTSEGMKKLGGILIYTACVWFLCGVVLNNQMCENDSNSNCITFSTGLQLLAHYDPVPASPCKKKARMDITEGMMMYMTVAYTT